MKDNMPDPDQVSVDALDFSDDDESSLADGDVVPQQSAREPLEAEDQPGLTGGATLTDSEHEDNVSLDDLSPDTLLDDSGAHSPAEPGGEGALDEELSVVDESQVGGGVGLDEAELARSAPLDGEPWSDQVAPEDKQD